MIDYGLTQYKKLNPKGLCILIEKMTENDLRKNGEIYIPNTAKLENYKIGVGKILDLSRKAKNETNLSKNDYVLYDYYSAHDDNSKNILTNYENIIMKVSYDEAIKFLNGKL